MSQIFMFLMMIDDISLRTDKITESSKKRYESEFDNLLIADNGLLDGLKQNWITQWFKGNHLTEDDVRYKVNVPPSTDDSDGRSTTSSSDELRKLFDFDIKIEKTKTRILSILIPISIDLAGSSFKKVGSLYNNLKDKRVDQSDQSDQKGLSAQNNNLDQKVKFDLEENSSIFNDTSGYFDKVSLENVLKEYKIDEKN